MNHIDIILSPELIPVYPPTAPTVYVVIDILRASSTIVAALHNGAHSILPIEHLEQAEALAAAGQIVGAERNVERCAFAHFGNDPEEYTRESVRDRDIYLTTTNGTRTLHACMDMGGEVVVGAFTNMDAIVRYCRDKNVLAVCAGWKGKPSLEDSMYAAALVHRLRDTHQPASDATRMMHELYLTHRHDLRAYIMTSDHAPRLRHAHKEQAIDYCLQESLYDTLPLAHRDHRHQIVLTNHIAHE